MDAPHSAFAQYRAATRHLPKLSERQQILTLKFELFHALQRGNDFQDRARTLEARIAQLEAPATEREAMLDAFARTLHDDLTRKAEELEATESKHQKETCKLRLALVAAETHCDLLDELCHDLVATIEKAAEDAPESAAAEEEVPPPEYLTVPDQAAP
jgi:uncharacterized coiled-coil protein SlyX